jgi:hypothetical protein
VEALAKLGSPVPAFDAEQIATLARQNDSTAVAAAEKILDRHVLVRVTIAADGAVLASAGSAPQTLVEQGWRVFLVRVHNPDGVAGRLISSEGTPVASAPLAWASRVYLEDTVNEAPRIAQSWFRSQMYEGRPMDGTLSGSLLEYQVIQVYSRDRGLREASVYFITSDDRYAWDRAVLARRGVHLRFDCLPSRDVLLRVRDADGRGCMASLTIKDKFDRVYPLQAMRLAPDMYFHAHIYRADGETVRLPDGEYTIESKRGPEYLRGVQSVVVRGSQPQIDVQLKRWIDPAHWNWYSGDTHIHAGGCAHYEHPTEGVSPETMIRQVRGEALSIGDVLSWGPSWYYQKQFFTGHAISPEATLEHPELQTANNANLQSRPTPEDGESSLRYDVEVSGFPSSHCGHLVLLRLKEQDYPGAKVIEDWPSWTLPILKWAREQGAVAGVAHCGFGMEVQTTELPNYEIPPMDGIGTQEAIVDVTHGFTDFLSGCDSQPTAELNAWYHMLNCGFRLAMVGETDYPCFSDDRPGLGRSYVRLEQRPVGDAGYEAWVRSLHQRKLYCGDGRSHFLDFKVNGRRSGEDDLTFAKPAAVSIDALVAARLEPEPLPAGARNPDLPEVASVYGTGWHVEKARIGTSREVPVDLVVNGLSVDRTVVLVACNNHL